MKHPSTRPSMRRAVNAMCKDCIFDPVGGGNWRQQVEACTSPSCALFELRPVSRPQDTREGSTRCARGQDAEIPSNGETLRGQP
jgi:hypothetical protein